MLVENPSSDGSSNISLAHAYFQRGLIHEKKGNMSQAIEDFNKALELDKSLVNAALAKAACANRIGKFEDAINTYNEALAIGNYN